VIVRRERPADHDAVRELHTLAFAQDPVTGAIRPPGAVPEARLVDELREDAGFLPHLSLVAEDGGHLLGHVIATRGWLEPYGTPVLGLGPLGVRPVSHGQGIGTVLVHAVTAIAEACEERLIALLGDPAYYRRSGFVRSTDLGIESPDPSWGDYFQARRLTGPPVQGTFRYADPFNRL
jgi:putative acetyltransferase